MATDLASTPAPEVERATFGPEIDLFTSHVEAIGGVLIGMVLAVQEMTKTAKNRLSAFEDDHCEVTEEVDVLRTIKIQYADFKEWTNLQRQYEHFELSRVLLPRSLLVSLISQYDAYLGRLLRTVFVRKPEILNTSERKISFETLTQFSSLDEVREHILEKEVEAILRSSHADQFNWMEKTFGLSLTKDLPSWPTFVEITERRNLFVHTDGIVSSQYMAVCKLHGCRLDGSTKEGGQLGVPQGYFKAAHDCIYEIGVKLGHVLWRKLFPGEREEADSNFSRLTYDLIDKQEYELAIRLLDFGCDYFKKFSNEVNALTFVVNRAQAYKWRGDEKRCKSIMSAVDWSAKEDKFRLADAVLAEDWSRAALIMKRLGHQGPIHQTHYRDWPLFRDLRNQEIFLTTYEQVFGEAFAVASETKRQEFPHADQNPSTEDGEAGIDDAKR
jgi:hypothetical protein